MQKTKKHESSLNRPTVDSVSLNLMIIRQDNTTHGKKCNKTHIPTRIIL